MANKKVQIQIDTKATGNGAKQTEEGLNKAAEAAERAAARQQAAAERAAQKAAEAAEKAEKRRIAAEQRAAAAAEKEAKRAAAIIAREEAKKAAEAEKASARMVKAAERAYAAEQQAVAKAASGRSQKAAQVGLQVQDIAVQAQAGTAATTILAQQGSQLLGAFGPTGAILGGVLAIGSAAAGVFLKMGEDVDSVAQKADKLKDALNFVKENAAKLQGEEIDFGRKAIERSIKVAQDLEDGIDRIREAERQYSEAALQNAESLRLAQVELRRLMGQDINEADEAAKKQEFLQKQIELRRQNEITAAEQKKQAAIDEATKAQDLLNKNGALLAKEQERLQVLILQSQELQKQKDEFAANEKRIIESQAAITPGAGGAISRFIAQKKVEGIDGATRAPFDAELQALQGRIDEIAKQTSERGGELYNAVISAAEASIDAQAKIPEALAVFEAEAAKINEATNVQQFTAAVQGEVEKAKARATEVNELIKDFVPANEQQSQALAIIKQKTSDLKITADEAPVVANNLALIQSALTTNNAQSIKSLQSILNTLNAATVQLNDVTNKAKRIEAQIIR